MNFEGNLTLRKPARRSNGLRAIPLPASSSRPNHPITSRLVGGVIGRVRNGVGLQHRVQIAGEGMWSARCFLVFPALSRRGYSKSTGAIGRTCIVRVPRFQSIGWALWSIADSASLLSECHSCALWLLGVLDVVADRTTATGRIDSQRIRCQDCIQCGDCSRNGWFH